MSAIGAVSPPGGDISEPVAQATLRIVKVFWGLDYNLSYRRHFPAINWLISYSLYEERLRDWYTENVSRDWVRLTGDMMRILQEEAELEEIVQLVGVDALSPMDRVTLEAARSIREDYLQQDAFNDVDTYSTLNKQLRMLRLIMNFYYKARDAVSAGARINEIFSLPIRERIGRAKFVPEEKVNQIYDDMEKDLETQMDALTAKEDS